MNPIVQAVRNILKAKLLLIIKHQGNCTKTQLPCSTCPIYGNESCQPFKIGSEEAWKQETYRRAVTLYIEKFGKDEELLETLI